MMVETKKGGCRNDSQGKESGKADRAGRNDQPDQQRDRIGRRLAIYFLPPLGAALPPCNSGAGGSPFIPLPPLSPFCPFGPFCPF